MGERNLGVFLMLNEHKFNARLSDFIQCSRLFYLYADQDKSYPTKMVIQKTRSSYRPHPKDKVKLQASLKRQGQVTGLIQKTRSSYRPHPKDKVKVN